MNLSDYIVLGIIAVFGIIGLINGFIFSLFKIASFFISVIVSIKFYPVISDILAKTPLYDSINASLLKNLLRQQQIMTPGVDSQEGYTAAQTVINRLPLPGFFKQTLIDKLPGSSGLVDVQSIMNTVSNELTKVIISIISLVLLYVLIRVGLFLAGFILRGIVKLPVLKQMDRFGGFAFGAVEGILTVYILFAVLMLFNSAPQFRQVFDAIDTSLFAGSFYQNNFIINWVFPHA